jgi:hypothetical protein
LEATAAVKPSLMLPVLALAQGDRLVSNHQRLECDEMRGHALTLVKRH